MTAWAVACGAAGMFADTVEVIEMLLYGLVICGARTNLTTTAPAGSPLHAPSMVRLAGTETRRPHHLVRQRPCQDGLQEHWGDCAGTEGIARGACGTNIGRTSAPEVDVWRAVVGGNGYSEGKGEDWMICRDEYKSGFGVKFEWWRKAARTSGR